MFCQNPKNTGDASCNLYLSYSITVPKNFAKQKFQLCKRKSFGIRMKKYTRLFIALIVFTGFVLLFIYRQKYAKLSTLFEMMNFQSKTSKFNCDRNFSKFEIMAKYNFSTEEMITNMPYWTEIFPGVYAYSSYWISGKTRTLIFSRDVSLSVLDKIECKLWHESDKRIAVKYTQHFLVKKKQSSLFLFLECLPFHAYEAPHSVSFRYRNMTMPFVLPVIYEDSYTRGHGLYALCVKPLQPAFKDVYRILEFIMFHSYIGVKFFIFYDAGMSLNVRRLLLNIGTKTETYVLILKWNLPFGFQEVFYDSDIYFIDCLHRVSAKNYADLILKLDIEHFVVPKMEYNLTEVTKHFDNTVSVMNMEEKKFCLEFPNDVIAYNLNIPFVTLLKTRASKEGDVISHVIFDVTKLKKSLEDDEFRFWYFKKRAQKTDLLSKSLSVIHSYVKCGFNRSDIAFSVDKTMWKYKDVFYKSEIYQLAKKMSLIYD